MAGQQAPSCDGGSIPTYPLHSLFVDLCELSVIKSLLERIHYSHSVFGVTTSYCFSIISQTELVGGAIVGKPAAFNVENKYGKGTLELRRFALIDECEKNSESRVLGVICKKLRKLGVPRLLSYADPRFGHSGCIYKASGFRLIGHTAKRTHWKWKDAVYPDRNIHQVNFPFHAELRSAIANGDAAKISIPPKFIYLRDL